MGDRAFAFYFPVVETFVMRPFDYSESLHNRSDYIAVNIACHFRGNVSPEIMPIAPRVNSLASFVLDRIAEIKCDEWERDSVIREWTKLKDLTDSAKFPIQATDVTGKKSERIELEVDGDTALVIFDWIGRLVEANSDTEVKPDTSIDLATARAIERLECNLERVLPDVFKSNYRELVEAAKERLLPPVSD